MTDEPRIPDLSTLDLATIPSAVLRRLIAEVRAQQAAPVQAYDRVHNRHNRGGGTLDRPTPPAPGTYNRVHNRHNRGL